MTSTELTVPKQIRNDGEPVKSDEVLVMVATINGFIILCLISTTAYVIGLLSFFADNEKDKCDMTYMFELPQYVVSSFIIFFFIIYI